MVSKNQAKTFSSTILHPDPTPNYGFDLEPPLKANIHHLKTIFSRCLRRAIILAAPSLFGISSYGFFPKKDYKPN